MTFIDVQFRFEYFFRTFEVSLFIETKVRIRHKDSKVDILARLQKIFIMLEINSSFAVLFLHNPSVKS